MQRALFLGILLLAAPLTGCIGNEGDDVGENTLPDPDPGIERPEIDFHPPQKAPHPTGELPTMTDPMRGVDGPVPTWWSPPEAAEVPETIEGLEHQVGIDDGEERGAGIAIFGSLAIVPGFINPTTIYDISDPLDPTPIADLGEPPARDVDTIAFPDGRLYAVFATDAGVVPVYNLTTPSEPEKVATIEPPRGSHNVGIVPGTAMLYNSASLGGGTGSQVPGEGSEGTMIYDLSDPSKPSAVTDFMNGYSCHDIGFYIAEDKQRAYCAGIQMTQIWDISDPVNPSVVSNVPFPHGAPGVPSTARAPASLSHLAMANHDGTVLIVGDETGGGVAPACDAHAEAGGQSVSGPIGNLWFYDVSDEENPELLGWVSPSHHYAENPPHDDRLTQIGPAGVPSGCTAHFGQLLPQDGMLAMAFYGYGVLLIDFSDPSNPLIVDRWFEEPSTNVWDVWYYQGHLFTGDLARGLDVLTLTGS